MARTSVVLNLLLLAGYVFSHEALVVNLPVN